MFNSGYFVFKVLTNCGLVTPYGEKHFSQYWLRYDGTKPLPEPVLIYHQYNGHIKLKDPPTWLRVAITLKKPPAPPMWMPQDITHSVWTPFHSMYENSTLCTNWFVHQANTTGAFIVHQGNAAGTFIVHQENDMEHFRSYIKVERSSHTVSLMNSQHCFR